MEDILSSSDEDLFSVREVDIPVPEKARVYPSLKCQECGESFYGDPGQDCGRKSAV
ncbi:MAG TPA: hypothetical protein VF300_04235 [Methanothrix sp.]